MTEDAGTEPNNGFLLDASTVVKLLLDGEDNRMFGHAVLELTMFEVTNTLYRIAAHEERLTREDATLLIEQLADLQEELELLSLQDAGGIVHVYETAWETSLTVYDAAYIGAAVATDRPLVTLDSGIHNHAPNAVTVVDIDKVGSES